MRVVVAFAAASLLAGCVQPAYLPAGPIQLQPYPPPVTYQTSPGYRPPLPPPAGFAYPEPAPLDDPLTPPIGETVPSDESGPIPLQDMPASVPSAASASPAEPTATPAPAPQKPPTSGPGSNVPLEGFRPMRGQTRPTP